ncbi:MAG: hypothetical protein WDO19_21350 [Bacteroidota bacterium]
MDKEIQSIRFFSAAIIAGIVLFGGIALFLNKIGHVPLAPALESRYWVRGNNYCGGLHFNILFIFQEKK